MCRMGIGKNLIAGWIEKFEKEKNTKNTTNEHKVQFELGTKLRQNQKRSHVYELFNKV